MNVRGHGPPSAKRIRLDNAFDYSVETLQGYNDSGIKSSHGTHLLGNTNVSAAQVGVDRLEQEPSECCYGMVRRTSIALIHLCLCRITNQDLHSYVISLRSSVAD